MNDTKEIRNYLKTSEVQKKSSLTNLITLLVSIAAFISLGLFKYSLSNLLILVGVIFIHEAGHYIGMRIFGYRDIHMFFIPLLGAATSGHETNPSGGRKAIVALLGPLPGIIFGILYWLVYFKTRNEFYVQPARMFLFINAFNLLPFSPLDGGNFVDSILFSRNPKLEVGFKLVTGLLLVVIAFVLKAALLGILIVVILLSLQTVYTRATIAQKIKAEIQASHKVIDPVISAEWIAAIVDQLKQNKLFSGQKSKLLAGHVRNIWQRVCNKQHGTAAAFGLTTLYLFSVIIALISPLVFETGLMISQTQKKIEVFKKEDGTQGRAELIYVKNKLSRRVELSSDYLFDGKDENYYYPYEGVIHKRGYWYRGKWNGEWTDFDKSGKPKTITRFDKGRFISQKTWKNGDWVEKSVEDLPKWIQRIYKAHEMAAPQGLSKKDQNLLKVI